MTQPRTTTETTELALAADGGALVWYEIPAQGQLVRLAAHPVGGLEGSDRHGLEVRGGDPIVVRLPDHTRALFRATSDHGRTWMVLPEVPGEAPWPPEHCRAHADGRSWAERDLVPEIRRAAGVRGEGQWLLMAARLDGPALTLAASLYPAGSGWPSLSVVLTGADGRGLQVRGRLTGPDREFLRFTAP